VSLVSIPWHPSSKDLRVFAGLQFALFALIAASLAWRHGLPTVALCIIALSAVVAVLGLVTPALIRPIYVGWMIAVFPIGWAVSHLILAVTFFLVITPIGWVLRLAGRDPLARHPDPQVGSYWTERPPPPPPEQYFRQF
jgi:hypothetical protein